MRNCKKCGFKKWLKAGSVLVDGEWLRQWKCGRKTCDNIQTEEAPPKPSTIKQPRKLYFDIETSLDMFYNFGRKVPSKFLSMDSMARESRILCFAAAWLDEEDEFQKVYSYCMTQREALDDDDSRVVRALWSMLDEADYWIGHNSDSFDIKTARWRFHALGYGFPYKAKQKDSLKLAKKYMRAPSNKLDDLAKQNGNGKHDMSFDDWKEIARTGSPELLLKMEMYCRHDVRIGATWFKSLVSDIEDSGDKVWN